jgi:para-nitrobenzyl esterase
VRALKRSSLLRLAAALGLLASGCHSPASFPPSDAAPPDGGGDSAAQDTDGSSSDSTLVTVAQGALNGAVASDGSTLVWRGVPYAAPPIGPLRWRPPAPLPAWTGVRDATNWPSACVQQPSEIIAGGTPIGDEDCLYLNIWAPAGYSGKHLPVVLFVHGGDWITGAGWWSTFNGLYLASHGPAVVVTINYRLGALGFLALDALAAEDTNHTTGNYGLLDQRAALQWVQQNIAAFGGDPTRVLLWGHSAGGYSALMHMASPLSHGLFSRAFSESGGTGVRLLSNATSVGAQFAMGLGCQGAALLSCLRAVPALGLAAPPPSSSWGPVVDGYVLTEPPLTTLTAGTHWHVPLFLGSTANEPQNPSALPVPPVASITSESAYEAAISANFGAAKQPSILLEYPSSSYASLGEAYIAVLSDGLWTCPTRGIARAVAASQTEPVWRSFWNHTDSSGPQAPFGAGHGVDRPYWFYNFFALQDQYGSPFNPNASEQAMGLTMTRYVANFVATGDPNGTGLPAWPAYLSASDPYLQLDDKIVAGAGVRTAACDFWDGL